MTADLHSFRRGMEEIRTTFVQPPGPEDLHQLQRMERWTIAATVLGFATAWIAPNPLSVALISTGAFARWTVLSHHILHGGYDHADIPKRYTSKRWATGWRRWIDWFDWMVPEAWKHEHNVLHHHWTSEVSDPDLVEDVGDWIRDMRAPRLVKTLIVFVAALTWKPLFYAPSTARALHESEKRRRREPLSEARVSFFVDWLPWGEVGRKVWLKSWLPVVAWKFVVLPLLFLPLGTWAWLSVLINVLLAEALTNLHSFVVVVPNHTGDDLWRYDDAERTKDGYHLRQILASVNYTCGNDRVDFLHGWLNYQIEHHLFPKATLLQYRRMQPHVKALCEAHGLPYVQESVFLRLKRTVDILVGDTSMKRATATSPLPYLRPTDAEATAIAS